MTVINAIPTATCIASPQGRRFGGATCGRARQRPNDGEKATGFKRHLRRRVMTASPYVAHRGDALMEHSYWSGWAYRDDRLVCGRARPQTIVRDTRVAADPGMDQRVRVRFLERISEGLRCELERLVEARGASGRRLADLLAPIEIVWDEPRGRRRVLGRLEPPTTQRHGSLEEISFPVHQTPDE